MDKQLVNEICNDAYKVVIEEINLVRNNPETTFMTLFVVVYGELTEKKKRRAIQIAIINHFFGVFEGYTKAKLRNHNFHLESNNDEFKEIFTPYFDKVKKEMMFSNILLDRINGGKIKYL